MAEFVVRPARVGDAQATAHARDTGNGSVESQSRFPDAGEGMVAAAELSPVIPFLQYAGPAARAEWLPYGAVTLMASSPLWRCHRRTRVVCLPEEHVPSRAGP
jgi:hypothetical protein